MSADPALTYRRQLRLDTRALKESLAVGAELNERFATELVPLILLEAGRLYEEGDVQTSSAMIEHCVHDGVPGVVLVDSAVRLATVGALPARKAAAVKKAAAALAEDDDD